ncbi:2OG-Fe dioxygenase family protein [Longispora urticae]
MKLESAMSTVMDVRSAYIRARWAFVDGAEMVPLLSSLGATDEDFERLKLVSDQLESDPTLPFRRSRNGRFCLDPRTRRGYRLESQPFVLSREEDFVRHDSETPRRFVEVQDDLQHNTALQALLLLQFLVVNGVDIARRPRLDYDRDEWICTLFNLRTVTTSGLLGEPALEGVHSDGVDHTMTTFLGSRNMTADSAETFLHDMAEVNGNRWNETDPALVRGRVRHRDFLDTLLLVDHEYKHSVSPVHQIDDAEPALRDMLIFFTRKPAEQGHVSFRYDSVAPHRTLPVSFDIPAAVPAIALVN